MSDSNRRSGNDTDPIEMDFAGLLPGDEQPRRRRRGRRPAEATDTTGETRHGEDVARSDAQETREVKGTPDETRHSSPSAEGGEVPEIDSLAPGKSETQEQTGGDPEVGEVLPEESRSASDNIPSEPSALVDRPGAQARSAAPDVSSRPGPEAGVGSSTAPGTLGPAAPEAGEVPSPTEPAERFSEPDPTQDLNRDVTGRVQGKEESHETATYGQSALIGGEDLDIILRSIASLTPEERSSYKTTITFSDDHYELLTDLRKEFRRSRGFAGHEATISNLVALGLQLVQKTLEAERTLPDR